MDFAGRDNFGMMFEIEFDRVDVSSLTKLPHEIAEAGEFLKR
jgi:hypothetical protein